MDRSKGQKGQNLTQFCRDVGSKRSKTPLGVLTFDRPLDPPEPKITDLLLLTFGGSRQVVQGDKTWGQLHRVDQWGTFNDADGWRSHTAAEMGPGPDVNPTAFGIVKEKQIDRKTKQSKARAK